tara:strand:- start:89 stop:490 length:402 start_codon:yes stop_codon:yes gene_type:complete
MSNIDDNVFNMMQIITEEIEFPWMEKQDTKRKMFWLNKNKEKNFVKRILNPSLNKGKELLDSDNKFVTHAMASADNFVYPTVIDTGKGKLIHLNGDDAYNYAMKTGEFIKTDSPEEANWLAKNYKTKKFKAKY